MNFKERTQRIRARLGKKQLVWFGVRGIDAVPLAKYGKLSHVYSQTAPIYSGLDVHEKSMELMLMHRVDLNSYDADCDPTPIAREFKRAVLLGIKKPVILIPYRPQEFLTAIYFTQGELINYFGLFYKFQRAFEHKPWVEKSLKGIGINVIPWEYARIIEWNIVKEKVAAGNILLIRPPYSSGGAGYSYIHNVEDIHPNMVKVTENDFFSISPFFRDSIPINVNACVYCDRSVRVFLPSLQLIGIKEATTRQLGYCGNDFGAVKQLGAKIINNIEHITQRVGKWLAQKDYVGIFGVDLLVVSDEIYIVEINPRFQGSTMLSAEISWQIKDADPYGEHIAAYLGFDAPKLPSLWERTKAMEPLTQLIVYNKLPRNVSLNQNAINQLLLDEYKGIPGPHITIAPEGMIFKKIYQQTVTKNGYTLSPHISDELTRVLSIIINQ